jgi:AraC-like DNA-binding protein
MMYNRAVTAVASFPIERTRHVQIAAVGVSQGLIHPDRVATFHDLLYLQEGGWEVYDEDVRYDLAAGDVLLLMAGRHHFGREHCRPGTRWTYVHFDVDPSDRYLARRQGREVGDDTRIDLPVLVRTRRDRAIERRLEDIVGLHDSLLKPNRQRARLLLAELLIDLAQTAEGEHLTLSSPMMRVIRKIETSVNEALALDDLAEVARMSRRSLTQEFRHATGQSVREYQLAVKVRVLRAHLTHHPELTLKELAQMVGFYDEYHLSRTFKRITGLSPSEYRDRGRRRGQ